MNTPTHTTTSPIPTGAIIAAEQGALGAAIADGSKQAEILAEFVSESDWTLPLHRSVFRAIREMIHKGNVPLDYNGVCVELMRAGVYQTYTNCVLLIVSLCEGIVLSRPMTRRIHDLRALWKSWKEQAE